MTIIKIGDNFNEQWLRKGFPKYWCDKNNPAKIMNAEFFRGNHDSEEYENKIVLGYILRIIRPSPKTNMKIFTSNPLGNSNKRQKIPIANSAPFAIMLICVDLMELPVTFAVLFDSLAAYQRKFGHPASCAAVSVGDCLGFVEPACSTDTLGGNMAILRRPSIIVGVEPQPSFPTNNPVQSDIPNRWVGWIKRSLKITLSNVNIEIGSKAIPCTGVQCDRQDAKCKGCFGKSTCLHPIVMLCDVQINNCSYDPKTDKAIFQEFRSYKFSKLFFEHLDAIASLQPEVYHSIHHKIRKQTKIMVKYINDNGGWTIIGWHKLGETTEDTGELVVSIATGGHIVRIEPTKPSALENDAFTKELIATPTASLDQEENP